MENILIIVGLFAGIIGVLGSMLPALPGPLFTYSTLFILYYVGGQELIPISILVYVGVLALLMLVLSNIIPVAATKITGASNKGVYGSLIGSILGFILFPPLGIFIGAAIGAGLAEYIYFKDVRKSINAGVGTTVGAIAVLFIQTAFSVSVFIYYLLKTLTYLNLW